jgi:DNA-binding protein HU-beta
LLQEVLEDTLGAAALAQELISFKQVGEILDRIDESGESFSEAATALKLLSRKQVDQLTDQGGKGHFRLGQLLVATTSLDQAQLESALETFPVERMMLPGPNVTKADLVARVSAKTGRDSLSVKQILETALKSISAELAGGGKVTLKNFGTFTTARHGARKGRNPRSGKPIDIPARVIAQLRFSRRLREMVE